MPRGTDDASLRMSDNSGFIITFRVWLLNDQQNTFSDGYWKSSEETFEDGPEALKRLKEIHDAGSLVSDKVEAVASE